MASKRKTDKFEVNSPKVQKITVPSIQELQNFCLTFPDLADLIFNNLDNLNVVRCREVTREWSDFLEAPKFVLMRKIKKTVETRRKFRKPWKIVLKKASTQVLIKLEAATSKFFSNDENFEADDDLEPGSEIDSEFKCITPLHVAAGTGNTSLWNMLINMV